MRVITDNVITIVPSKASSGENLQVGHVGCNLYIEKKKCICLMVLLQMQAALLPHRSPRVMGLLSDFFLRAIKVTTKVQNLNLCISKMCMY